MKDFIRAILAADKLLHCSAAYVITTIVAAILHAFAVDTASVWGAMLAFAVLVGKELYDRATKKGTPEAGDIVAGIFGIIAAVIVCVILGI